MIWIAATPSPVASAIHTVARSALRAAKMPTTQAAHTANDSIVAVNVADKAPPGSNRANQTVNTELSA